MSKRHRNQQIWHNRPTAHISCLYPEILAMIFGYLDVKDKGSAAQVCCSWRDACYRKSVWKGVEAKIHLKHCDLCPTADSLNCTSHNPVFYSLIRRGIKRIQVIQNK